VSGVDELLAFVRRCLDDDERVARAAMLALDGDRRMHGDVHWAWEKLVKQCDPVADIKAKRAILDRYEDALARQQDPEYSQIAAHVQAEEYEDWIIPTMAQPFAGREGWREEWLVSGGS
jgi:hypothetical protein